MPKFWCHNCEREYIGADRTALKCLFCDSEFIENIEEDSSDVSPPTAAPSTSNREHHHGNVLSSVGHALSSVFGTLFGTSTQPHSGQARQGRSGQAAGPSSSEQRGPSGQRVYTFNLGRDNPFNVVFDIMQEDTDGAEAVTGGSFADLFNALFSSRELADSGYGMNFEQLLNHLMELDGNRWGTPPTAKDALSSLPLVIVTEEHIKQDAECAVCMERMKLGDQIRQLPCHHLFHDECITPWLKEHSSCPVCRYQLPTDDPDFDKRYQEQQARAQRGSRR